MLLAIDIGNTHTVLGLFAGQKLRHQWRIRTDHHATGDELATTLRSLLALHDLTLDAVESAILGSVVPSLKSAWQNLCRDYLGQTAMVVGEVDPGITIELAASLEVGADRIINAVAGFARYHRPLIIVDFGTAITFDCVSETGAYMGGAIAPGLGISMDALSQQTAKLPSIDISKPPAKAMGTSTEDAIRSGILFGYGGLVEGLVARLAREFPAPPLTIATGGMAELIAPFAPTIKHVLPSLTLEGLRLIHERNS
ncbi:MAG: type III pantothenate kinase [Thermodesulfobacteriota bacterium]